MITILLVSLVDLLIRMMVLGQLLMLGALLWRSPASTLRHLLFAAGVSVARPGWRCTRRNRWRLP
jgi:hypothetical protein